MKIFGYWRSSCSYRVRIAFALKGVSFENRPVHLLKGDQKDPEFLEKNPMGQVPTLVLDDGRILAQSMAILDYLDVRFPEPPLYPREPFERARVLQLAEIVNAGIQPLQNSYVLLRLSDAGVDSGTFARDMLERGLGALERELVHTAGRYAFGDRVTAADVLLVPQMYNARRFDLDMSGFPTAVRVDDEARKLPAFFAARPEVQPDAPPDGP